MKYHQRMFITLRRLPSLVFLTTFILMLSWSSPASAQVAGKKFSISFKDKSLYGYSTYKRTELEWENTFTFRFNRYISSRVFIYPRFDDGVRRDDHYAFWQLKEFASIGFQYSF